MDFFFFSFFYFWERGPNYNVPPHILLIQFGSFKSIPAAVIASIIHLGMALRDP